MYQLSSPVVPVNGLRHSKPIISYLPSGQSKRSKHWKEGEERMVCSGGIWLERKKTGIRLFPCCGKGHRHKNGQCLQFSFYF